MRSQGQVLDPARRACLLHGALLLAPPVLAGAAPRRVAFISQDFRNSGVAGVFRAFEEACSVLGWHFKTVQGRGDNGLNRQLVAQALKEDVDGIVLGGVDAADVGDLIEGAKARGRPVVVGWHAASTLKPSPQLFVNISTELKDVAAMSVDLVEQSQASGRCGVVLINDSRFSFANLKTQRLQEAIQRSKRCELLATEDVKISTAGADIPRLVPQWARRHGRPWTHVIAINDIYFESMTFPLRDAGRPDIKGISAGDGSASALGRIATGRAIQVATIAEPLGLQGWQLADELVRAFAGMPPSGRITQPIAITTEFMRRNSSRAVDDDIPYREEYRKRWMSLGLLAAAGR